MSGSRIGQGFDAHRLVSGRPLMLGGVEVPHDRGLEGHSDGDVLLHATASALLGAIGEGDLGRQFPSSNPEYQGIASSQLLRRVMDRVRERSLAVANLDATLIAEKPRLGGFLGQIEARIAELLEAPIDSINVKVTSTDGLGAIGRAEGIASLAVVLLEPKGDV